MELMRGWADWEGQGAHTAPARCCAGGNIPRVDRFGWYVFPYGMKKHTIQRMHKSIRNGTPMLASERRTQDVAGSV